MGAFRSPQRASLLRYRSRRRRRRLSSSPAMPPMRATIGACACTMSHVHARGACHHHAHAEDYSPPSASIMVDGNTGQVLEASNPDALRHPASLTKIMTLYLLFERLDAGKIKLDTPLKVSEHAADQDPTKLELKPGQTIPVEDAIKGVVTRSANDAAVVIAENLGGSERRIRQADDAKGSRAGHEPHHLCQRVRPAGRRSDHHGARPGAARPRHPGPLSALLQIFFAAVVRLSRRDDPQSRPSARIGRRRRRHQDRIYPRVRLQSRHVGSSRRTLSSSPSCSAAARRSSATPICAN